jgi:hypothetical protein
MPEWNPVFSKEKRPLAFGAARGNATTGSGLQTWMTCDRL